MTCTTVLVPSMYCTVHNGVDEPEGAVLSLSSTWLHAVNTVNMPFTAARGIVSGLT